MEPTRFKIIFDQLDEAKRDVRIDEATLLPDELAHELDEIEVLRQIILEIQTSEPSSYTTS